MIVEILGRLFYVLFVSLVAFFLAWAGTYTDNQIVRLLAILALGITWRVAHVEHKYFERLLRELEEDDEEPPKKRNT